MFNEENAIEKMAFDMLCSGLTSNKVTEKFADPAGKVNDREHPHEI